MSVLGSGISGLLAFQRALATTSHNIANAATEGYSRQRVDFATNNPQRLGSSYIGQGVQVAGIRRLSDDWVNAQLRTNLTNSANGAVRAGFAERVDSLLANDSTGLAPVLESYFKAVQDVANDPTSLPARTVMLKEAETLTDRFARVNGQLDEQRTLVNGQISTAVEEINQYAQSLADLNNQIVARSTAGSPPNDLLDRRDTLLNELAEKIELTVTEQDDGALNVFIGNGQALVVGAGASQLVTANLSGDKVNLDIGLKSRTGGEPVNITRFMSGGELGGLLETRTELLDSAQNQLGLVALNLATAFNEQNRLGRDLDGEMGADLFTLPKVSVSFRSGNTEKDLPDVKIEDVTRLQPNDYRLTYNGTGFQLFRLPDNKAVELAPEALATTADAGNTATGMPAVGIDDADQFDLGGYRLDYDGSSFSLTRLSDNQSFTLTGSPVQVEGMEIDTSGIAGATAGDSWAIQATAVLADGLRIDASSLSGAATGDSWLIQPTRFAASGIEVAISEPEEIAAAAAVKAEAGVLNTGKASIDSVRALDGANPELAKQALVTYDGANYGVKTQDASGAWVAVTPAPSVSTQDGYTTISANGWELRIKGTPAQDDTFTVGATSGQEGDNRNVLAMSELQSARLVEGQATIEGGYNSILARVGTQTRQAQIARDSSATLLESAQAQREAISGVNLDEEAANMMRYQQAYQAAAQVIAASSAMFDTLLSAVRR